MAKKTSSKTYLQLSDELAGLIEWFEGESVNLDEAAAKYEQAVEIITQMEDYLKTTQNKIKKITAKFE